MSTFDFVDRILVKAELMESMMRTLDVKDALAEMPSPTAVMRDATLRCLTCRHGTECASWLAMHENAAHPPSFCRNRHLFEFVSSDV